MNGSFYNLQAYVQHVFDRYTMPFAALRAQDLNLSSRFTNNLRSDTAEQIMQGLNNEKCIS